jgi:ABC-type sulfate transport system permease component
MEQNTKIILIVVIAVVVALILLLVLPILSLLMQEMKATSEQTVVEAQEQVNKVLCRSMMCTVDSNCTDDVCGSTAKCVGVEEIGGTLIPGHCDIL